MDKSLLLVDDEPSILRALKRIFHRAGYKVTIANGPEEALAILEDHSFPIVLSDYRMPNKTGGELLIEIKEKYPSTLGLILSGYADLQSVIAALNSGAVYKFLEKPWDEAQLLEEIDQAFEHWRQENILPLDDVSSDELGVVSDLGNVARASSDLIYGKMTVMESIDHKILTQAHFSLVYLDIRHFRHFNDCLGYQKSDQLLHHIHALLKKQIRADVEFSLMNGAAFVFFVPEVFTEASAFDFITSLLSPFKQLITFDERELLLTFSAGYSVYPDDGLTAEALVRGSQLAANYSKDRGLNVYPHYKKSMDGNRDDMVSLQSELCQALKRNEFTLYYQPKISLVNGKILGAEALIRWHHSKKGLISPDRFIPLAELTGLIEPIGEWVLSTAIAQSFLWQQEGLPAFIMSVNVSGRQLVEHDLATKVKKIIQDSGLSPEYIELEVTETFLMQDIEHSIDVLKEIRALGVKIAIDDFGTGYSSLNYLTRLPVDTLKVDRSFITDFSTETEKTNLVKNMIVMSHDLGMRVVAEGVETLEQLQQLKEMNCDEVQGYYFSRPVVAEEFKKLLQAQSWAHCP
ncbi:EAL domain-containing protein [Neptuniibacter sp. 2_MG-2023]|uniref:EAL domain-containing response regulator n=1 Tax=Neptuniibacter sp. 2_MG-2023 TaxID=3062671 RepID=UPI0026E2B649|nr:EAL domain-containing protein [Neptuniibacter sp. 2_MG-2023]MDO6512672.1 EAL domain-containing protein [Neptuniibacter sp. 2_MG-2023]